MDIEFGNRLYQLRKKAGLSQSQLGEKVGVSNKSVSKWENGQAKPNLNIIHQLADVLGVSVDALLKAGSPEKRITKIVITGGPCAGKTTAMSWIQNAFTKMGYSVLFVDETATQLITGGAAPWLNTSNRDFQWHLLRLQLAKEQAFTDICRTMKGNKALIVCDRAAMDNCAYMTEQEFGWVLKQMQTNKVALRDQYDAVFHLVTAAKGAEKYYTLANNQARTETLTEASALDDKLIAAWTGHPHFRVVDNSTGFEEKMLRLLREITSFLGEPSPMEIERKFLITRPNLRALEQNPHCARVDIIQTYLKTEDPSEELRIRQRGSGGHYIYFMTRKKRVSDLKRVEVEERLSQEEYLSLMVQADPAYRSIHKQRYCLSENGLYYEIDIYPDWGDTALMEIELHSDDQEIILPEGIEVIREVTGEEAYTNRSMARLTAKACDK
jgi:CYTH domain-containing protein/DNA-binding XRE family transcriptional regulator/predicted ATPase